MSFPMSWIPDPAPGVTDDEMKKIGLAVKPLGDYRSDKELEEIVNTIFAMQGGYACFGTLLGLVREGSLLQEDTDIDFGVTVEHVPGMVNSIIKLKNVAEVVRKHETYVTLKTKTSNRFVDFYLTHLDAGHRFIYCPQRGGHWDCGGMEMKWNMSILDGLLKFWIPNNPEHLLQCWYGPTWRIKQSRKEFFKS